MRCEEPGWVRIGQYDRPRRRSLWARVTYPLGYVRGSMDDDMLAATSVELCAGREGDDAAVTLDCSCMAVECFRALVDVIEYAIANLPEEEKK